MLTDVVGWLAVEKPVPRWFGLFVILFVLYVAFRELRGLWKNG